MAILFHCQIELAARLFVCLFTRWCCYISSIFGTCSTFSIFSAKVHPRFRKTTVFPQKQKAWDMPSSSKSSMKISPSFSHDFPIIFPYYPYFPMIFPWFLSHLSPSPGWGLVLWSLGSFLQRGRGLPAGPLGLLGLSEGLSYLAVPWRGWKPWWSWHTTCIPSGNLT